MIARIWSLVVKEIIHLRREPWMPLFMLVGGVLELLIVGWATSRPITNVPLMVIDQDQSAESREFIVQLENTETFSIHSYQSTTDFIQPEFENNRLNTAIIIPPDFSEDLLSTNGQADILAVLNGSESVTATIAMRTLDGMVADLNNDLALRKLNLSEDIFSDQASLRVWFNESLSDALYTVPAEMAMMLEFTVLIFAALAFSRERELGTLEQLLVMPFKSSEIIIGKAIPAVIISFADFLMMLGMVVLVFGIPIRGSLPLLLLLAVGYLIVELSKGLLVSILSRTQHQAFMLVMMLGMMDFMFTGYAAPVEAMPKFLQLFANLIPAHHWLKIFRGILLKNVGLDVLWPSVLALGILGLIWAFIASRVIRKALN